MNRPMRFKVEPLGASIDFSLEGDFSGKYHAIVINESHSGCCLAARNDDLLDEEQMIRVKVGNLKEMPATVIWIKKVDEEIIKFGLEYND